MKFRSLVKKNWQILHFLLYVWRRYIKLSRWPIIFETVQNLVHESWPTVRPSLEQLKKKKKKKKKKRPLLTPGQIKSDALTHVGGDPLSTTFSWYPMMLLSVDVPSPEFHDIATDFFSGEVLRPVTGNGSVNDTTTRSKQWNSTGLECQMNNENQCLSVHLYNSETHAITETRKADKFWD